MALNNNGKEGRKEREGERKKKEGEKGRWSKVERMGRERVVICQCTFTTRK